MAVSERDEKCFTFLWKLENVRLCSQKWGEKLVSPSFVVDDIGKMKWNLLIYPRGKKGDNLIGLSLRTKADRKDPYCVQAIFDIAFITNDGTVLTSSTRVKRTFHKGEGVGYLVFQKHNVFIGRMSSFLPQDTITARCRIWKSVGEITEDVRCTAVTSIGVEKISFKWNVKTFSTFDPEKKCSYEIKSVENDAPLMSVGLFLTEGLSSEEIIRFELSLHDQTIKYAILKLFLIDISGNKEECNQEEIWFDDPTQHKLLAFSMTKKTLLKKESLFLPEDTLSMFWEWTFSRGIASEGITEVEYGCIRPEEPISGSQNINNDIPILLNILVDNMKSLYDEHFLSDIKLKTNTSEFPAHKLVLSAQSSVFKGMFSNDMNETYGGCVNIGDLSDDTVTRMLLFIYTARVENLTWKSASDLYIAADKYAIFSLKNICSSYLKNNLNPRTACEVLLSSNLQADGELKSAAQDYVLKNGEQTTKTDEWKTLVETNAKLAVETLCLKF